LWQADDKTIDRTELMIISLGILAAAQGGTDLGFIWNKATPEAKVIIVILGILSIGAWSMMIQKFFQMRRAAKYNGFFETEFRQQEGVLGIFDRRLPVEGCPMFSVYTDGCNDLEARLRLPDGSRRTRLSIKSIEHVKRQVEGAVARESLRLESGLILLAIAVSGGPFMGLLGTVWGVMDTFGGIAKAGRADLTAMAPGVAAALVTTVAGLLVAIPSMFGYNYLVHTLRVLTVELDNFAQTLASKMETEFLPDDE
jgi:biopolymer transport protein ExbB/TolQ